MYFGFGEWKKKNKPGYLSNGPGEKADEEKGGKRNVNLAWLLVL